LEWGLSVQGENRLGPGIAINEVAKFCPYMDVAEKIWPLTAARMLPKGKTEK